MTKILDARGRLFRLWVLAGLGALGAGCGKPVGLGNRPCPCLPDAGYACCDGRCILAGQPCGVAPAAADAAPAGDAGATGNAPSAPDAPVDLRVAGEDGPPANTPADGPADPAP